MSITVPLYGFGGGGGLNFDVKDFRTEAELLAYAGKENRIGVVTPISMTGWRFDTKQPEDLREGEVWFTVGSSSTVGFNAIKKNNIQIYPLSAKQYVGGALTDVVSMSYQGGAWESWFVYLYNNGTVFSGWESKNLRPNEGWQPLAPTITYNADNMYVKQTKKQGGNEAGIIRYMENVDLSKYSKVCIDFSGKSSGNTSLGSISMHVIASENRDLDKYATSGADKRLASVTLVSVNTTQDRTIKELDVSSIDKTCSVALNFGVNNGAAEANIYSVWLK